MRRARKLVYGAIKFASRFLSLQTTTRLLDRGLYPLMYHGASDHPVDDYDNPNVYRSSGEFEADMKFLAQNFEIVSALDLIEAIENGRELNPKSVVITLDDGLRSHHEIHRPILNELGIPASFFVNTAFVDNKDLDLPRKRFLVARHLADPANGASMRMVERYLADHGLNGADPVDWVRSAGYTQRRHIDGIAAEVGVDFSVHLDKFRPYLTSDQIRSLIDDGFSVGSHSIDHSLYSELPDGEAYQQTVESVEEVVNRFGLSYRIFAFPHNDKGMKADFFQRISSHVDLTFGTAGFVFDPIEFSIQRGAVESTRLPIEQALRYTFLYSYITRIAGRRVRR